MSTSVGVTGPTLFVVEAPGFHGAAVRTLSIGRELRKLGRQVFVAVPPGDEEYTTALRAARLDVVKLGFRRFRKTIDPLAWGRSVLTLGPAIWTLARFIRRHRIVSVHTCELHQALGPIAGQLAGAQVVWHLGNLTGYGVFGRPLRGLIDRLADQVVPVCRAVSERQFPGRLDRDRRFIVLPTPVDLDAFRPGLDVTTVGRELGRRPGEVWIAQVGGLYPVKGVDQFVRAAALVRARASRPVRFVHAGPAMDLYAPYRAEILELIQTLGLRDCFQLIGTRTDVPDVLNLCDIVVNASLSEGLPSAVAEAMACGRPVVATRVGGLSECVIDGQTGVLVPPGDVEALAAGMLRLVEDHDLAGRMGRAARTHAEVLLGPAALGARLAALL